MAKTLQADSEVEDCLCLQIKDQVELPIESIPSFRDARNAAYQFTFRSMILLSFKLITRETRTLRVSLFLWLVWR